MYRVCRTVDLPNHVVLYLWYCIIHVFIQSMVGLACDLMLDSMECCADGTKWAWFNQYCMAARMAKALQRRTVIPQE